jgi:flagellar basal-body rod modification protein FlgD
MEPITSSLSAASNATTAQPQSNAKAQEQKNQFLQLLVAQLKGQNPLNPQDGSEFVAQLAQFSSLEELTQIRSGMDQVKQLLSAQNEMYMNQTQELF